MEDIRRRQLVIAAAAWCAAPLAASGQAPARVARIGFLGLEVTGNPAGLEPFVRGLGEVGLVRGRNVVVEVRDADRKLERLPALAAELVALEVDVIVAPSVVASQAAKAATRTIPIVFAGVADPVSDGLVASLARPGGNVTGLSNLSPDMVGKRIELLKETVPSAARIAVLWQPGSGMERTDRDTLKDARGVARSLGVQLAPVEVRTPADLEPAFAELAKSRIDAFVVLGTPMFFTQRARVAGLAAKSRLPAMYTSRPFVEAGGLMSYGASLADLIRRTSTYVDRILKGARPGDLPVEQPTKFELVVNLRTAKALGLAIPPAVLGRADETIT